MTTDKGMITEFYKREISLFRELLECISLERDNLINVEIKSLWDVMEEKNRILKSIEDSREQFNKFTDLKNPYDNLPNSDRKILNDLNKKLARLKQEVRAMVTENVSFINETLDFFNDMIAIFTSSDNSETAYGPASNSRKKIPNLIYRNEV